MIIRTIILVLLFVAISIPSSGNGVKADSLQMKQLVPTVTWPRKTDRTYVFSRSQLMYSLGNDDYIHHWIDRPLLVDPSLDADTDTTGYAFPYNTFRDKKPSPSLMSLTAYVQMQKTVLKYGLDGLAFFPGTFKRSLFYNYTKQSDQRGFQLLSEFIPGTQELTKSEILTMALANPASFKINGKVVITSYVTDSQTIEYVQDEIARLKKQYGDTFVFLPSITYFGGKTPQYWMDKFHHNTVTLVDIKMIKDGLRGWLRATDGLYCASAAAFKTQDRIFDQSFYQDFVIRLMKSVLAEPEFKQKLFGLSAVVGHENNTRVGYTLSSDGTKTLRSSFEAAMAAQPELINIPEWDEQNENTSLRPTVYNGYSSMRIMRYYTSKLRGTKLAPLPGDDTVIPDLIISYRKTLAIGEKLEIELLNVPDSDKNNSYSARLILEDINGKPVYSSPLLTFASDQMKGHTLLIPSESLAENEVVCPKLEIESDGHKSTFKDGLHYIRLCTSNWDYKWVKQSLRDLLKPTEVTFNVGPPDANGKRTVGASFTALEPLQHIEVLDNDDVSYSYSADNAWHDNANQVILRLSWEAIRDVDVQGKITLQGATARWLMPQHNFFSPNLKGETLLFENTLATKRRRRILIAIPRSEINTAALNIDLPGIYQGTVSVKNLIEKSIFGIPGPEGFNLVINHYLSQDRIPPIVNAKSVRFSIPIMPRTPDSVLHLQAIGKSGRIYRSKPIVLHSSDAKALISVYSKTAEHTVHLNINSNRVPDIRYQFNPSHGSVLMTDAGQPYWGILGGYFSQVTGRGGGNAGDDTPFLAGKNLPKDITKTAPEWVKTDTDEYALQFDGKGNYISLPQGVIPRWSGFVIQMSIKPDSVDGSQLLIANRSRSTGSISVYLVKGVLMVRYYGQYSGGSPLLNTGLQLTANKWADITIRYDQEKLTFLVNGKPGKSFSVTGPGVYDTASVVGGFGNDWFKGQIKSLRIQHRL